MRVSEAIDTMIELVGKSKGEVAVEIGRHPNFIRNSINRAKESGGDWSPQVRTLVEIASACGYSLVLVRDGRYIAID